MGRLVVASQLDEVFNTAFAEQAADIDIVAVPRGAPDGLPQDARVLIAAPFRRASDVPPGWPFDLQWVQLVSVGIDFYPDWLLQAPIVTNARGTSAVALAEFALASILAEAKRFPELWIDRASAWQAQPLKLVSGTTLGLVGFGAVGEALAPRAQALGLKVLAVRRSNQPIAVEGVERVASVAELFARSDHVVLAAPSTADTRHLINREILAQAKPGLHLINIARGALINDAALLEALDSGQVGLASLDVTEPEPAPENHPFYSHPRVRLSPHSSVHTPDTRRNLATQFAANLARFRQGAPLHHVVDLDRGY